jgi:hypothetical protein
MKKPTKKCALQYAADYGGGLMTKAIYRQFDDILYCSGVQDGNFCTLFCWFWKKQYFCGLIKKIENMDTMLIELTNHQATGLLHELEALRLIKILRGNITPVSPRLSDKYRGIMTREQGEDLKRHINEMRNEWDSI